MIADKDLLKIAKDIGMSDEFIIALEEHLRNKLKKETDNEIR